MCCIGKTHSQLTHGYVRHAFILIYICNASYHELLSWHKHISIIIIYNTELAHHLAVTIDVSACVFMALYVIIIKRTLNHGDVRIIMCALDALIRYIILHLCYRCMMHKLCVNIH